ncbi:MAG: type I restriction enzyme HsdR N-terminal domain-containing protein [Proteobacteria bacterium]|nr:type I restriction enzyme HsdR N-terminal domain-containing protein [Pseudomonadota bacterium]MBU4259240.1 type I restriction enzyme HsdR N-terminal domain-containing protein [Pseudomonadota bacterium]MBU4288371.1 type I restriction enzyme HsdR N-terminal domain-containing protein [Pseudomonadota bacterium]MCG2759398.1 type I restriction enzyme HsdR N-terminal domain-containing protein [Desulfobacteraceae bacterium]
MADVKKSYEMITDFITGEMVPDIGAEANRQDVERFLVNEKGFSKEDIEVDVDIEFSVVGESYKSQVDLVVCVDGTRYMAIKCAAGSLGSREREIIAASRLLESHQLPISVVSDGKTAIVLDTASGKKLGEGLNAVPSKDDLKEKSNSSELIPLPAERLEKEKLIFRSYDVMNVNVQRNI